MAGARIQAVPFSVVALREHDRAGNATVSRQNRVHMTSAGGPRVVALNSPHRIAERMAMKDIGIRVVLVDDHSVVRECIAVVLGDQPGLCVVGHGQTGWEAVSLAARLRPDVMVMDILMPGLSGVEATRQLLALRPGVDVVCLTMVTEVPRLLEMHAAGCRGFVLKHSPPARLVEAIQAVHDGRRYVDSALAKTQAARQLAADPGADAACDRNGRAVSARERQVLQLIADGKSSKQIGQIMSVSVHTVTKHRQNITEKLGISGAAELTRYAIREGMAPL